MHRSSDRQGGSRQGASAAGVERDRLYVTNAVKHFKFTLPERGKRRIHKTPSRTEVVRAGHG